MTSSNFNNLKTKSDTHWARKAWHFLGVLLILGLYLYLDRNEAIRWISVATFIFLSVDILRQHFVFLNEALLKIFAPIMRDHEQHHLSGVSYLLIGVFFIIYFFSKEVVTLALLFLAIGDPLASLVGLHFGKDKLIGHKSLQGSFAAFLACTILAALYYYSQNMMVERILIVSLLSGLIGAVAELIPVGPLDDNLTFPILSSFMLWLLFYVFGG